MSLKILPLLIGLLFCVISAFEFLAEDLNIIPVGDNIPNGDLDLARHPTRVMGCLQSSSPRI